MIIWLISEINNNNCLSLLIRALNSKWNPSAEFQKAGFAAQDSALSWKKRDYLYLEDAYMLTPKTGRARKKGAFGFAREVAWRIWGIFLAMFHDQGLFYVPSIQESQEL